MSSLTDRTQNELSQNQIQDHIRCFCTGDPHILAHFLAREREDTYGLKLPEERRLVRERTLETWPKEWDQSTKGRWTHRLIGCLKTEIIYHQMKVKEYLLMMEIRNKRKVLLKNSLENGKRKNMFG